VQVAEAAVQKVFPVENRDLRLDLAADSRDHTAGSTAAVVAVPAGCTGERTVPGTAEEAVVAAERRTTAVLPVVPAGMPAGLSSHKVFLPTEHTPAVGERRLTEGPLASVPVVGTPAAGTEPVAEGTVPVEPETGPSVAA
jgi:hypothetical protein